MLFNSGSFLLFFPIVLILYGILPKKSRYIVLLCASWFFYMCLNPKYIILLLFTTLVTWVSSLFIEKSDSLSRKKTLMIAGAVSTILVLFVFKYLNFFLDNLNLILSKLNISAFNRRFDILLPIGISFFTFQALGYLVDVYRGKITAEHNFFRYALFVSFFPLLLSGPIERADSLLVQLNNLHEVKVWDFDRIKKGSYAMLWGYFLKIMLADRLSIPANTVFDNYYSYGSCILIGGAIAYTLQIYCDFASYSLIAVGCAKIMGIKLTDNFDTPYFAMSIKEFWRRWHISLSTWLKDYIYIPLGGNRKGTLRKYLNIMITFLVSGLWHGANWTFVVWGGLHGIYQIVGDVLTPVRNKVKSLLHTKTDSFSYRFGCIFGTFLLTSFAWIFFRAQTISDAVKYIGRIFTKWDPWTFFDSTFFSLGLNQNDMFILLLSLLLLLAISLLQYKKQLHFDDFLSSQGGIFQFLVVYALIMIIIIFGKYGDNSSSTFIYFQF